MSRSRKKKRSRKFDRSVGDRKQDVIDEPVVALWRIWLPGLACCLVIVISGVAHGLLTHRWSESTDLRDAVARLQSIPKTIGDWESSEMEIPADQLKQAGAAGHVYREYRNRKSNAAVQVLLLCGDPGPISVHPPDVCFTGAGWSMREMPSQKTFDDENAKPLGQFQTALFQRNKPTGAVHMRIVWAWNATGAWEAPDRPRFAFAGSGHLYKLYVTWMIPEKSVGRASESAVGDDTDPAVDLLRALIAEMKKAGI